MTRKGVHEDNPRGRECPRNHESPRSITAAIPTRARTTVSGGSSTTATPTQKKAPPHSMESRTKRPHSVRFMIFGSCTGNLDTSRRDVGTDTLAQGCHARHSVSCCDIHDATVLTYFSSPFPTYLSVSAPIVLQTWAPFRSTSASPCRIRPEGPAPRIAVSNPCRGSRARHPVPHQPGNGATRTHARHPPFPPVLTTVPTPFPIVRSDPASKPAHVTRASYRDRPVRYRHVVCHAGISEPKRPCDFH